jgi:hypothetical protein
MEHLEKIQSRIYEVRGVRVMLDFDLAALYQVETRVLKQAVRRNIERFPEDFLFRLTLEESNLLIYNGVSQIVIPPGYNPGGAEMFAFTEQGVAMLSGVLKSPRAIQVNISIMRAFVAMRNYIMSTRHIEAELAELRAKLELLERNDEENLAAVNDLSEDMRGEIADIYQAIAALSVKVHQSVADQPRQKIGFKTGNDEKK